MATLRAKTDADFQTEAFTAQFCRDKLTHYRELRAQHLQGVNTPTWEDITRSLNTWLDELCGVLEIRWVKGDESEWRRHAE